MLLVLGLLLMRTRGEANYVLIAARFADVLLDKPDTQRLLFDQEAFIFAVPKSRYIFRVFATYPCIRSRVSGMTW